MNFLNTVHSEERGPYLKDRGGEEKGVERGRKVPPLSAPLLYLFSPMPLCLHVHLLGRLINKKKLFLTLFSICKF